MSGVCIVMSYSECELSVSGESLRKYKFDNYTTSLHLPSDITQAIIVFSSTWFVNLSFINSVIYNMKANKIYMIN